MTLYFAYGSNLCLRAMQMRCPEAIPVGKFKLLDSRLVFRGVADCIFEPGSTCHGGLWRISRRDEDELDRYEGIRSGHYRKEYADTEPGKFKESRLMFYVMNSNGIFPPSEGYLATIRQGYMDFGLPVRVLNAAVKDSWDNKAPSARERERHDRKGRPPLARPIPKQSGRKASEAGSSPTGNAGDLFEAGDFQ